MKTNAVINNPLLRWAGGKRWMIEQICSFMPIDFNNYHEPFVGGGSVFFNIERAGKAFISDSNRELICFYQVVKSNVHELLFILSQFENSEKEYYGIRSWSPNTNVEIAARFYYLNRTCFNGLYRVNQGGNFNVPYGFRKISVLDLDRFESFSSKLKNVDIACDDFEQAFKKVMKGDFVFIDPPYTVAHNKNGFIEYNQKIFTWQDQERLARSVQTLMEKGVYFLMTNAFHDSIKMLYKGVGTHFEIERFSTISGAMNSRQKISELIITNC
jgi:DNA adenine methylase